MIAFTVGSNFGAQENKIFHISPSICHKVVGLDVMNLVFCLLSFKPAFSLSSLTFTKRLFISSPLSASREVASAYLKWLMLLQLVNLDSSLWFIQPCILHHLPCLLLLFSCSVVSGSLQPYGLQHARLSCSLPSPGACSNLCPLRQWCHLTISSSVVPFSSCLQSFPASGSYPMSRITLHRSYISRVTTYSLDILLSKFWTSQSFHVQF